MGHQTMLNPELEDHTGGDLGYLIVFSIDYFALVKNQLKIIETIFISDVSAWRPSSERLSDEGTVNTSFGNFK